jgi:hypothetical protein
LRHFLLSYKPFWRSGDFFLDTINLPFSRPPTTQPLVVSLRNCWMIPKNNAHLWMTWFRLSGKKRCKMAHFATNSNILQYIFLHFFAIFFSCLFLMCTFFNRWEFFTWEVCAFFQCHWQRKLCIGRFKKNCVKNSFD